MEGICITYSCIPLYNCVLATHNYISQWWIAGMGNTDTLHPNSCFCSFSIPRSKLVLVMCKMYYDCVCVREYIIAVALSVVAMHRQWKHEGQLKYYVVMHVIAYMYVQINRSRSQSPLPQPPY